MVDLERKIRATQAQQGGFSTVVLGTRIGYEPSPPTIAYFTANSVEIIGEHESFNIAENIAYLENGGPFGEHCAVYIEGQTEIEDVYIIGLGESSPGTKDYTFEFWFQGADIFEVGFTAFLLAQFSEQNEQETYQINKIFYVESGPSVTHFLGPNNSEQWREINASIQGSVWIHIAIVCYKGNHNIYVNGQLATNVVSVGSEFQEPIPLNNISISMSTVGRLGQMRYTQEKAIYSGSTITVPTAPFFVP